MNLAMNLNLLWLHIKRSANRRNIVCQQLPTLLDGTYNWVRLHTLLHVVGSIKRCEKFGTGQTEMQQLPT